MSEVLSVKKSGEKGHEREAYEKYHNMHDQLARAHDEDIRKIHETMGTLQGQVAAWNRGQYPMPLVQTLNSIAEHNRAFDARVARVEGMVKGVGEKMGNVSSSHSVGMRQEKQEPQPGYQVGSTAAEAQRTDHGRYSTTHSGMSHHAIHHAHAAPHPAST